MTGGIADDAAGARTPVVLADGARQAISHLAAAAYPHEGCGVLMGTQDASGHSVAIDHARPGRNLRADRPGDRYELDPGDIIAAEREGRSAGLEIVGFWHSHPDHPARPSQVDVAHGWETYVYLIAATTSAGMTDLTAWHLDGTNATSLHLATAAPAR